MLLISVPVFQVGGGRNGEGSQFQHMAVISYGLAVQLPAVFRGGSHGLVFIYVHLAR